MTLDELKHILRFQLNPGEHDPVLDKLTVEVIDGYDRRTIQMAKDKVEDLLPMLEGLVFDAHRVNGNVVFIKPEA